MKGELLETSKNCEKKSHIAEKNLHKKILVMGGTRTQVLLLGRPQKSLIKLYAKRQ